MKMTPFAVSGLLAGIFSLAFGLLVLFKSMNKRLGRIWCLFTFSTAMWGFGAFWIGISQDPQNALLAWRFAYGFGVIWIPTLFFHFVCVFCELHRPKSISIHYLISFAFFLLMPTDNFFNSPNLLFDSLYFPNFEWPYILFVAWWLSFIVYSHIELGLAYRKGNSKKRAQIKYFFLATAIGYIGGSLVYFPNFGIEFYPWGNFTVFLYPLIMSYAMIRFNFMDITLLVRRTVLILGLYLLLLLLSTPVLFFFHVHNQRQPSILSLPLEIIVVSLILSAGPFLYAYVVRRNTYSQTYTLAGLTHELKSPLAIIQGALEFLNTKQDLKGMNPDQLTSYLQMIERNSSRLQFFVNDLLLAFHGGPKDIVIDRKNTDFVSLIDKVIRTHEAEAKRKEIKLDFVRDRSSINVSCDPIKIDQVFSNLLTNALKFSDSGSIQLSLQQTNHTLITSIKDQGTGIPSEDLPYIFDRFYQGQQGRQKKGTGIGLTIAKLWIESHGGKIWAESEGEGKGTTVTFTLPLI